MKKAFFWSIWLTVLLGTMLTAVVGFAAGRGPVHEMDYFQSYLTQVDGRKALRIEIGMDHADLAYKVAVAPLHARQLVIDLEDASSGELRQDIKLEGTLARFLTFRETAPHHIRAVVKTTADCKDKDYHVYTLAADRKSHKPYRLVIDILEPSPAGSGETAEVKGVAGHVIVLDPGHGGSDSGAVGPDGVQEKDVTLKVADQVRDILQASGAHVAMTRDADVDVYGAYATDRQELQARVDAGNYTPGMQVFLSIHCNSFSSADANGTQTFYYPKTEQDAVLAQDLQDELIAAGGLRDRGISEANFYVVKHAEVPAALVELAFISNYNEEGLLASPDFQHKVAMAIAKGLGRFFQDEGN